MPVLPLRPLPVNDANAGLIFRVDFRTQLPVIYVRRESDKFNWICTVRSPQLISSTPPSQTERSLDANAVATCLYNGFAIDTTTSGPQAPLELRRREVVFYQPEHAADFSYRLTMAVAVRAPAIATVVATPAAAAAPTRGEFPSLPRVDIVSVPPAAAADETMVFAFTLVPAKDDIERVGFKTSNTMRRVEMLQLCGVAFPSSYVNWVSLLAQPRMAHPNKDEVTLVLKSSKAMPLELTLTAVHVKGPALFVVSVCDHIVRPTNALSYQPLPGGELFHTVTRYSVMAAASSYVQVVVLPGSAPLVQGTTLAIREMQ